MERVLFRVPGEALSWGELAGRLMGGNAQADAVGLADRLWVEGRRLRESRRLIPAGSRVRLEASLVLAREPDWTCDRLRVLVPAPPWRRGHLPIRGGGSLSYRVTVVRGGVAELILSGEALRPGRVLAALSAFGRPALGDARRGGVLVAGGLRMARQDGSTDDDETEPGAAGQAERAADDALGGSNAVPWWPAERVFPDWPSEGEPSAPVHGAESEIFFRPARWHVSRATARIVRAGHPWLLPDRETESVERWRPGTLVEAVDPRDVSLGWVRTEGPGPLAARVWSRAKVGARVPVRTVEDRVKAALARRAPLLRRGSAQLERAGRPFTDAVRLIHGEADGLPGIAVDRLGPILRMIVTSHGAALALVDRVAGALERELADPTGAGVGIVVVVHLRGETTGRHECVRFLRQPAAMESASLFDSRGRLRVNERGLVFAVDAGLGEPEQPRPGVGLYLDQRENRQRLAKFARRGGRWLNLFAHTGAFSVALLASGAEEVVSVDLSRPYLDWLEENLSLNRHSGVDPSRHRSIRRDGRRYLDELAPDERFAGIVLDPPTAAAAGRRFWSTPRDLSPLVGEALARLDPGGVLLVSRNHRGARSDLAELVKGAALSRQIELARVEMADPGPDFPRQKGFKEGDSFRGVLAVRG